jgi:hypothetical protein
MFKNNYYSTDGYYIGNCKSSDMIFETQCKNQRKVTGMIPQKQPKQNVPYLIRMSQFEGSPKINNVLFKPINDRQYLSN